MANCINMHHSYKEKGEEGGGGRGRQKWQIMTKNEGGRNR